MNPNIICTPQGVYVLKNDTHLSRWIENHGRLDIAVDEISQFAKHIPDGGVVIDAGACLGDHTATYAKLVGLAGMVHAFEPHPDTFEALSLNFSGQDNVICINAGLLDANGTLLMTLSPNVGASRIDASGDVPVRVVKIDSMNLTRLDFVHLDCEGCELRVLLGARETIARCHPVMVLEVNHGCLQANGTSENQLLFLLEALNYRWEEMQPHHGPHLLQRDIICLPK